MIIDEKRPHKKKARRFRNVFKRRTTAGPKNDKQLSSEQSRVDELINRANEAYTSGRVPGAEYR